MGCCHVDCLGKAVGFWCVVSIEPILSSIMAILEKLFQLAAKLQHNKDRFVPLITVLIKVSFYPAVFKYLALSLLAFIVLGIL